MTLNPRRLRQLFPSKPMTTDAPRDFFRVHLTPHATVLELLLPELLDEETTRLRERKPLLKPGAFHVVDAERGIYESERYLFIVYLPGADGRPTTSGGKSDPDASSRAFAAYAWPVDAERGKHHAFYVDQFEQICESDEFAGAAVPPSPSAYALNALRRWRRNDA